MRTVLCPRVSQPQAPFLIGAPDSSPIILPNPAGNSPDRHHFLEPRKITLFLHDILVPHRLLIMRIYPIHTSIIAQSEA